MHCTEAAERGLPEICAATELRNPVFHLFSPKLRMPTALGHRPNIHDQFDLGVMDESCQFLSGRDTMS